MISHHQKAKGSVKCFVVDAETGKVVEERPWQPNLILNQGMDQVASMYWAELFMYCSAGTGTTSTSDSGGATEAVQSGFDITLTGGLFTFTSTAVDAGKIIKWSTGEETVIATVVSPTTATAALYGFASSGQFTVYKANQTQLENKLKVSVSWPSEDFLCKTTLDGSVYKMQRTYDFTPEVSTVSYTEIGMGWSQVSDTCLFSRVRLASPVTVTATRFLRVSYELQLTLSPSTTQIATANISGWPIAPATKTGGYTAWQLIGLSCVSNTGAVAAWDSGMYANEPSSSTDVGVFLSTVADSPASFGSCVDRHNGSDNFVATTSAVYTPGSYTLQKTGLFDAANGNGTGWISMGYGAHKPSDYWASNRTTCVFVFYMAQTKVIAHTLSLAYRFSWSRTLS